MDNEIVVEQGLGNNFKGILQKVYDYLNDCNISVDCCSILEDLGFDNGSIPEIKNNIGNSKDELSNLLSSVSNSEETFLEIDDNKSKILSQLSGGYLDEYASLYLFSVKN